MIGLGWISGFDRAGAQTHSSSSPPLKVCVTLPDLGSITTRIGGEAVSVTVFARGPEDPHFLEAKPGFVKAASEADLFIQSGLELEVGWVPAIMANARNPKIQPGGSAFLDTSKAITPLEIPTGTIDRSMGDVHPAGNPHYLTDPLNGLKAARLITDQLEEMRPESKADFETRYTGFRKELLDDLVGPALAAKYDAEKLALLHEHGQLLSFLKSQGDDAALGGWLGEVAAYYGVHAVADHNLWPYFAKRYGIVITGFLEPKPGVAPTTKHLSEIVEQMKRDHVGLILSSPYFDPKHAAFVSGQTGAKVIALAHQAGGRTGTDDYLAMCTYNVDQLAAALKAGQ